MKRIRVGGDEQDAFSRAARQYQAWRPGERKAVKTKANRRFRREGKNMIRKEMA